MHHSSTVRPRIWGIQDHTVLLVQLPHFQVVSPCEKRVSGMQPCHCGPKRPWEDRKRVAESVIGYLIREAEKDVGQQGEA